MSFTVPRRPVAAAGRTGEHVREKQYTGPRVCSTFRVMSESNAVKALCRLAVVGPAGSEISQLVYLGGVCLFYFVLERLLWR